MRPIGELQDLQCKGINVLPISLSVVEVSKHSPEHINGVTLFMQIISRSRSEETHAQESPSILLQFLHWNTIGKVSSN